jgi:signal transduction histidine kinase
MLERIFEMFVQERVAKNGSEGLGLGLGLAKRLVDLHGGSIRATSPGLGQGSTFEVSLPLGVEQTGVDAVEARWEIGDRS